MGIGIVEPKRSVFALGRAAADYPTQERTTPPSTARSKPLQYIQRGLRLDRSGIKLPGSYPNAQNRLSYPLRVWPRPRAVRHLQIEHLLC